LAEIEWRESIEMGMEMAIERATAIDRNGNGNGNRSKMAKSKWQEIECVE
jgi:hypothetical protein